MFLIWKVFFGCVSREGGRDLSSVMHNIFLSSVIFSNSFFVCMYIYICCKVTITHTPAFAVASTSAPKNTVKTQKLKTYV